jgi:hypothetical protein
MKFNKALFGDNAMEDIDLLKALFGDKLIEAVKNNYDKYEILLKEESVNNNYSISISNVPDYAIAIKTDNFPDLKGFFECSSDRGQCKCADFVIVADKNLVFIELSSTKKQENEVKAQLKGAECVVEYCKSIIKNFYQTSSFSTQYNHSFVSIYNIGGNKITNKHRNQDNCEVNKFLKINAPKNIQFNQLLCNANP